MQFTESVHGLLHGNAMITKNSAFLVCILNSDLAHGWLKKSVHLTLVPKSKSRIEEATMKKAIYGAACLCLLLISPMALAGEWVEDPVNGCSVWSDEPTDGNDIVSWSGECTEGKASGHGVLTWISEGKLLARYVGVLKAGKLDGIGNLHIQAEQGEGYDHWEAEFAEGEIEGEVILKAANGDQFQGQMKQSLIEGYGSYIGASGDRYDGEFVKGLPEGEGFSEAADGETYHGMFKAGERHGQGTLIEANGDRFEGEFAGGKLQGWGSWLGFDGARYEGQFMNGKPNGRGIYRSPEGDIFTGGFRDGVAEGEMTVTTAGGEQSIQTWRNGELVE